MKYIRFVAVVVVWIAATSLLTVMVFDCMEWEVERREAAAAKYREQMNMQPQVTYAVYEVK